MYVDEEDYDMWLELLEEYELLEPEVPIEFMVPVVPEIEPL